MTMMTSTMGRVKHSLLNVKVSRAIAALVTLFLIYIIFRVIRSPSNSAQDHYGAANRLKVTNMDDPETRRYMEAMVDNRPLNCLQQKYKASGLSVSILIHFNEDQFYKAKLTLHSIIENTPDKLYNEIILLDDGSSQQLHAHARDFLIQPSFRKVSLYRSDIPEGEASSKHKATKLASGSILVFLSSKTVVNKGWLEPLIQAVVEEETRIATPHVDNFLPDHRFFENKHNLVNTMSMTLGTYHYEREDAQDKEDISYVANPVLRGDAFAVRKSYLEQIGDFDEAIQTGGGEYLELSLRVWMCGGEIKVVPCSRVVTHDALTPQLITNAENLRRINELWLGNFKSIVYYQSGVDHPSIDDEYSRETLLLKTRKNHIIDLHGNKPCHSFDWYHDNVAKALVLPNSLPRHFGILGDRNSLCIHRTDTSSPTLNVVHCRAHTYDPLKIIEMTPLGKMMMGDLCIKVVPSSDQVSLGRCEGHDSLERWDIDFSGRVFIRGDKLRCLTHTMERNRKNELVHFLTMEGCKDSREQTWKFTEY